MTPATIAALVFFVTSLLAALADQSLLARFARSAGVDPWALLVSPALMAMLFALIVYQKAERKIRRVGQSVSRGILVMLLTWLSFAALVTLTWSSPREFLSSLGTTLAASGIVGGGPMLLDAVGGGIVTGVLIIRKPQPRIE